MGTLLTRNEGLARFLPRAGGFQGATNCRSSLGVGMRPNGQAYTVVRDGTVTTGSLDVRRCATSGSMAVRRQEARRRA